MSVFADTHRLKHVYLDTKRLPASQFPDQVQKAMGTFHQFQPDVVMLGDDNALRLLGPTISEIGTPIVYFGINNNPRNYFEVMPKNVIGIIERVPLFPWVRHLRLIAPEAKNIHVIMDDSHTSKAIVKVTFADRKSIIFDNSTIRYTIIASWSEWQRTVLEAGPDDIFIMPTFHALKNDAGENIPNDTVAYWTSTNSPVPIFTLQDYAVGDTGAVGAFTLHGMEHGRIAALLVNGILEGKDFPELSLLAKQKGTFYFNKKQLQRFGLTLPRHIEMQTIYR
ncbi:hypothetical protein PSDVSF_23780 [Pseudodesulfovibrio sediminis]|uniref:Uncharacterized protein n=2 Tax=Pseudodesulfovibrio sediminis TaxID=2810563 RepID=A0ABM7P851_9BACT|nr:hypothetical protein PSDVSF_23780 [Pseudodesulfovibrio sediminis]